MVDNAVVDIVDVAAVVVVGFIVIVAACIRSALRMD